MADQSMVIDFRNLGGPVYSGRSKGELARRSLGLDAFDDKPGAHIIVKVPDSTYSVTTSFFLGLLGTSVRKAGSREAFLARFSFEAPDVFTDTFNSCISRALQEQTALVGKRKPS